MASMLRFMIGRSLVLGDAEPALMAPSIYVTEEVSNAKVKNAVLEVGGDVILSSYVKLPVRDKSIDSGILNLAGGLSDIVAIMRELIRVSRLTVVIAGWQPDKGWSTTPMFTSELSVIRNKVRAVASAFPHDELELSDKYIYVLYLNTQGNASGY